MQARFYAPWYGRFLSPDPARDQHFEETQSWNIYSYVQNNPTMLIDPTGEQVPWSWALRHPGDAMKIGQVKDGGTSNISSRASNFAINLGFKDQPGGGMGGDRNAMRHVMWQAMITKEFGANTAKAVGDGHESNPNATKGLTQDTKQVGADSLKAADQICDLMNNEIGRRIGSENPSVSNAGIAGIVLEEFHNNGLWEAKADGNGGYTVSKTKLDDKKYDAAKTKLEKTDDNGKKKKEESSERKD